MSNVSYTFESSIRSLSGLLATIGNARIKIINSSIKKFTRKLLSSADRVSVVEYFLATPFRYCEISSLISPISWLAKGLERSRKANFKSHLQEIFSQTCSAHEVSGIFGNNSCYCLKTFLFKIESIFDPSSFCFRPRVHSKNYHTNEQGHRKTNANHLLFESTTK